MFLSPKEALYLGLATERGKRQEKERIIPLFREKLHEITGAANSNTVLNAREDVRKGPWAILSKRNNNLISVFPNYKSLIKDLEKVETKENRIKKLIPKEYRARYIKGSSSLYDDEYLTINPNSSRISKFGKRFKDLLDEDPDNVMDISIPGLNGNLKAIKFGSGRNVKALFKIKD